MSHPSFGELGGRDPYDILELPSNASDADVRLARKRLLRRYHPDLPAGDLRKTQMITAAADLLLDPIRRIGYYDLRDEESRRIVFATTEPEMRWSPSGTRTEPPDRVPPADPPPASPGTRTDGHWFHPLAGGDGRAPRPSTGPGAFGGPGGSGPGAGPGGSGTGTGGPGGSGPGTTGPGAGGPSGSGPASSGFSGDRTGGAAGAGPAGATGARTAAAEGTGRRRLLLRGRRHSRHGHLFSRPPHRADGDDAGPAAGPTSTGPAAGGSPFAGPTSTGPTSAGPTSSGRTFTGPAFTEPTSTDPAAGGPTSAGPTSAGPTSSGRTFTGPAFTGRTFTGPASPTPTSPGPRFTGPDATGPAAAGPASTGPASTSPTSTSPAAAGPTSAGPGSGGARLAGPGAPVRPDAPGTRAEASAGTGSATERTKPIRPTFIVPPAERGAGTGASGSATNGFGGRWEPTGSTAADGFDGFRATGTARVPHQPDVDHVAEPAGPATRTDGAAAPGTERTGPTRAERRQREARAETPSRHTTRPDPVTAVPWPDRHTGFADRGQHAAPDTLAAASRWNALAIASVVAILTWTPLPLVLGLLALSQIHRFGQRGARLALTGVIVGTIFLIAYIYILVVPGL